MARVNCSICKHPQVKQINAGLAKRGVSQREVAASFGLNQKTLWRHATLCVSRAVSKAIEKQEVLSGVSMIDDDLRVRAMYDSAMSQTYQSGDFKALAPLGKVYLQANEQIARLAGFEGFKQPQTNVTNVQIDGRGGRYLIMPYQGQSLESQGVAALLDSPND